LLVRAKKNNRQVENGLNTIFRKIYDVKASKLDASGGETSDGEGGRIERK
jgi:hypothetical protein